MKLWSDLMIIAETNHVRKSILQGKTLLLKN